MDVPATARALLDAHVSFVVSDLTGPALAHLLEQRIEASLDRATRLTLNDVVTPVMIRETALRYASELELRMAVPELAGGIARVVHGHRVHQVTTLADVLPDRHVEALLDKAMELRRLRGLLTEDVLDNPAWTSMIVRVLMDAMRDWWGGARSGGRWLDALVPGLDAALEAQASALVGNVLASLRAEAEAWMESPAIETFARELVLDVWDGVRKRPLSRFLNALSAEDVEELFVILYEYWLAVRKTPLYKTVITAGIDAFFEQYGDVNLAELLDEIGITREHMLADAKRFAPHVIGVLHARGMLEPMVRSELSRFYLSGEVERVLGEARAPQSNAAPTVTQPRASQAKPGAAAKKTGSATPKPGSATPRKTSPASKRPAPKR